MALMKTIADPKDVTRSIHVAMTADEEKATRGEWAQDDARRAAEAAKPKEKSLADRLAELEAMVNALRAGK